jgi:ATP-binding cassette subfamily C (CFTR/MRP) protein 4
MLIPAALLGICFYVLRKFYFETGRAIKRLEGVARSPVFAQLSTTLYGLTTIRAFGVEAMFQKQFEAYLDIHSSVWYLFLATSRWLGLVVDWLGKYFILPISHKITFT